MRYQARALKALEGSARIHELPLVPTVHNGLSPSANSNSSLLSHQAVTPGLSQAKNQPTSVPGAVYGSLPYEALGYALGSVCHVYSRFQTL